MAGVDCGNAEKEIEQVGWQGSVVRPAKFISERIAPLVRSVAETVALNIIAYANSALQNVVLEHAVWTRSPEYSERPEGAFAGSSQVMSAAVPLAAGAAVASALPYGRLFSVYAAQDVTACLTKTILYLLSLRLTLTINSPRCLFCL